MTHYLKDYTPFPYHIADIDLFFELSPKKTVVTAIYSLESKQVARNQDREDLLLYGSDQKLHSVKIDSREIDLKVLVQSDTTLLIPKHLLGLKNTLSVTSEHNPEDNQTLQGLYTSNNIMCTQCEPHGMRHIIYHPDRPDVMSRYKVTIRACRSYQHLLSNGNLVSKKIIGNQQEVVWEDPHPKPSYLFALVAGNFDLYQDTIVQEVNGQKQPISLEIYTPPGEKSRAQRAMHALKAAMSWDLKTYKLPYDLERFMIVAVHDFNAGAMENKGLNIFNASHILADATVSEDNELLRIDRIVAHEYFHNWSGNRITLRDWFQLTLKEGLTVFREQQFSAFFHDPVLERLEEIAFIQTHQFSEDRSALSHPILPKQYEEIDNFYTTTVYDKGAEVIGMLFTILGEKQYFKAMQEYFSKFDGQAICALDFFNLLKKYAHFDIELFEHWYHRRGTPVVYWSKENDILHLHQHTDSQEKSPLLFPLRLSLIHHQSKQSLPFTYHNITSNSQHQTHCQPSTSHIVIIDQKSTSIQIQTTPPCSEWSIALNVGFSAPINLIHLPLKQILTLNKSTMPTYPPDDKPSLATLVLFASDAANPLLQGSSCKQAYAATITQMLNTSLDSSSSLASEANALFKMLLEQSISAPSQGFNAYCLTLPTLRELLLPQKVMRFEETEICYNRLEQIFARSNSEVLLHNYQKLFRQIAKTENSFEVEDFGARALSNAYMHYLVKTEQGLPLLEKHISLNNMTLHLKGLSLAMDYAPSLAQKYLDQFHRKFKHDPLTIPKWFSLQAQAKSATIESIESLKSDPLFDPKRPRLVRALISAFISNIAFSKTFETSYPWLKEQVLTWDKKNPHLASSLLSPFKLAQQLDPKRQAAALVELTALTRNSSLSNQTLEIVNACLKTIS